GVARKKVRAEQAPGRKIRHALRGRLESQRDREVRVVLGLERARDPLLERATKRVSSSMLHVADPRGDDLAHATGGDEMLEADVRDRPHQRQVASLLPDQLVGRSERDETL